MKTHIFLCGRRSVYRPTHHATRKSEYIRDDLRAAWDSPLFNFSWTKCNRLHLNTQSVPRSKQPVLFIQTSQLTH